MQKSNLKMLLLPIIWMIITATQSDAQTDAQTNAQTDAQTEPIKKRGFEQDTFSWNILEGPIDELESVESKHLLYALRVVKDTTNILSDLRITKMVHILLERDDFDNTIYSYLHYISGRDIFDEIPLDDWSWVEYLGNDPRFDTSQYGIIAAKLFKLHGTKLFNNHSYINEMNGILCGFGDMLHNIPTEEFRQIRGSVFMTLRGCDKAALRTLLVIAMKPTVVGPPQIWKEKTLYYLGMLILAMTSKELASIRPKAMRGLRSSLIDMMSIEQLKGFTKKQVDHMRTSTLVAYKSKFNFNSRSVSLDCNIHLVILIFLMFMSRG